MTIHVSFFDIYSFESNTEMVYLMFKLINIAYFILNLMPATSKIGMKQQKLGKVSKTM